MTNVVGSGSLENVTTMLELGKYASTALLARDSNGHNSLDNWGSIDRC